MTVNLSRRGFLQSAAAAASVLYIGTTANGAAAAAGRADAMLNPFVKIDSDGTVIAIIKHFEKGQGPATGLSTLIAEELGVTMDQIGYEFAPSNPEVYNNLFFGPFQGTGGSTAMANSWMQYRTAGANAREMLIKAAAQAWGVDAASLDIQAGVITGGGQSAPLGDFVAAAAEIAPSETPRLRAPSEWKIIGKESTRRVDSPIKVNGQAKFGMDVHLPNQMVVMIKRTPQRGGLVASFDDSAAKEVKGFIMAMPLPTNHGVAVYAENTWAAMQARRALEVEWDMSGAETRSSAEIRDEVMAALNTAPVYNVNQADQAAVRSAVDGAATVVEKTFYFPLLAHAPMEPLNCTIEQTAEGDIVLHDGAQMPTGPHMAYQQIFQLPPEKIRINTMLAGGSFGRRATPDADYQVEAGLAFVMTDRTRPVKLVWDREDDIRGGYYRPATGHKVRVGLNAEGNIVAWDHQVAGQSIMKGTAFEAMAVRDGIDHSTVEGLADNPYVIPNMAVGLTDTEKATSVLWWRSVGHTHTAYVMEVMMDMAAKAVGRDPVAFRLAYLEGGGQDAERKAGVLKLVAEKGNWGRPPLAMFKAWPCTSPLAPTWPRSSKSRAAWRTAFRSKRSPPPWIAASPSTPTSCAPRQRGPSVTGSATPCVNRSRWMAARWSRSTSPITSRCGSAISSVSRPTSSHPPKRRPGLASRARHLRRPPWPMPSRNSICALVNCRCAIRGVSFA